MTSHIDARQAQCQPGIVWNRSWSLRQWRQFFSQREDHREVLEWSTLDPRCSLGIMRCLGMSSKRPRFGGCCIGPSANAAAVFEDRPRIYCTSTIIHCCFQVQECTYMKSTDLPGSVKVLRCFEYFCDHVAEGSHRNSTLSPWRPRRHH